MPRYANRRISKKYTKTKRKPYRRPARPSKKYGGKSSLKKMLNLVSTKKRDTMLTYSNTSASKPAGDTAYGAHDATLIGGQSYIFPWIATARPAITTDNNAGFPIDQACRTASTCYMRGLKERITMQTNTGSAWQWRRICFTMKGDQLYSTDGSNLRWSLMANEVGGVTGMVRVLNSVSGSNAGSTLVDLIFRGKFGQDWNNVMSAPLDQNLITVKYDKTRSIQSGNDDGILPTYSRWDPMVKNFISGDDENGGFEDTRRYSAGGKAGMGDYYVVDIINSALGSAPTDQLILGINSTLYWHEK
nr:capsid protein [Pacific flying fox faeces associated gemycircularvirus-11]